MKAKIKVNIDASVFNPVYLPYLYDDRRTQIFFGGSSSGKSVFLTQRDVVRLMQGGRNFLVCRQVGRTLRGSVVQEVRKIIREWNLSDIMDVNKTDGTITCANGYQMVFAGLDNVEKLKSVVPEKGVFTDIRVEEATESDVKTIKQLLKRQRGGDPSVKKTLTLSFNPILQDHWVYKSHFASLGWSEDKLDEDVLADTGEYVIKTPGQKKHESSDLLILKTNYRDNAFLTPEDIADLENEEDRYFYEVYTLGNWGVLGNVIFKNWEVDDLSGMRDQFTNPRNGLDFGYAEDPAALWCSHYDKRKKTIYLYDEFYATGLDNEQLAYAVREKIGRQRVICDSAEPKSIAELKKYGVNAYGAVKGQDSVNFGIQWMQRQRIVVDKSCINAQNELRQFKWKEDKSGKPVSPPIPLGINDHLIAAGRYAHEEDAELRRAGFVKVKGL